MRYPFLILAIMALASAASASPPESFRDGIVSVADNPCTVADRDPCDARECFACLDVCEVGPRSPDALEDCYLGCASVCKGPKPCESSSGPPAVDRASTTIASWNDWHGERGTMNEEPRPVNTAPIVGRNTSPPMNTSPFIMNASVAREVGPVLHC